MFQKCTKEFVRQIRIFLTLLLSDLQGNPLMDHKKGPVIVVKDNHEPLNTIVKRLAGQPSDGP